MRVETSSCRTSKTAVVRLRVASTRQSMIQPLRQYNSLTSNSERRNSTHVDAQRDIPVASVRLKLLSHQLERDERDVRVVHGLQSDTLVCAVQVAVSDELLDG